MRQICTEEFQIIYTDILHSKWSLSPYSLRMGCAPRLPSQEDGMDRVGKGNFPVEKADKHCHSRVTKVSINRGKSWKA